MTKRDWIFTLSLSAALASAGVITWTIHARHDAAVSPPSHASNEQGEDRELSEVETPEVAPEAKAPHAAPVVLANRAPSEIVAPTAPSAPADPVASLKDALSSDDRATRIDAIEAAWKAGRTDALPVLEKSDLAKDPDAAPTIIRAVAELGAKGTPRERDDAASTLGGWLSSERKRETTDATGNVSMLVEALGDTGSRDAVGPLTGALDAKDLPLYIETLAVEQLGALGDSRAEPAVARFAARVAALQPTEGVDEELRNEAAQAAADALKRLAM